MLKMRLGALPDTEVKMPQPLAKLEQPSPTMSVRMSVHIPKMVKSYGHTFGGAGRQAER